MGKGFVYGVLVIGPIAGGLIFLANGNLLGLAFFIVPAFVLKSLFNPTPADAGRNYGGRIEAQPKPEPAQLLEPVRWKQDGTIAGLKIGYLDEHGCFVSPDRGTKWKNDHMRGKYICMVDPQHPNGREMLQKYVNLVVSQGHEPIQASISAYGTVNQMDDGELIVSGAADIVAMCNYYG